MVIEAKKTEVTNVTMRDGRVVGFPGSRKMQKEVIIDGPNVAVRFDFVNGETLMFILPPTLLLPAAGHGASQKLGDMAAGEADPDDMFLAVEAGAKRLSAGESWNMPRESGGFSGASLLLRALVENYGKPIEKMKEWLSTKTKEQKTAMSRSAKLKPIIDRLVAEKLAKSPIKVDTDVILSELEGI